MSEHLATSRPAWDAYFLGIARAVAARADCRRARFGAVIVDTHHRIVATGYNGSPPGGKSCLAGECPRGLKTFEEIGENVGSYNECIALHSEQNAIANSDAYRCRGGTLYLARMEGDPIMPCPMCAKLILAAGITRVVI